VKGLARATGGAAEFISAGERIDEKVLRTFSRLASPLVSDIAIDWDGCDVQTLAELPPVFDGDVMSVLGRCPGRLPREVRLSCKTASGPQTWTVPVGLPADHGGVIATMWARRTIQSIEEVNTVSHGKRAEKKRQEEMLVSLSKQFGLLCGMTTFIAVEHRSVEERNEGKPALRRVPVQLAAGWGDLDESNMLGEVCSAPLSAFADDLGIARLRSVAPRPASSSAAPASGFLGSLKRKFGRKADDVDRDARYAVAERDHSSLQGEPPSLTGVLSLQSADGWFAWGDAILFPGHERVQLEADIAKWIGIPPDPKVTATLAALVCLRQEHRSGEALWRRAYNKALHWLSSSIQRSAADIEAWLDVRLTQKQPTR
jgi:Ca-activated chloride channel family protein